MAWGAITLGLLLVAILLRLQACQEDLWVDELHSAWVVSGTWNDLPARAAIGNQSPLYFCLLRAVTQATGLSEFSLRSLSLAAGMGLVITGWWFAKRTTRDDLAALVAAAAIGLDSTCIFYSSEARPYALMQLALAWHLILVITNRGERWKILVRALLAALAIHLQLTAAIFLTPLYISRALLLLRRSEHSLSQRSAALAMEAATVLLLAAPLTWQATEIAARGQAWASFISAPSLMGVAKLFSWWTPIVALAVYLILLRRGMLPRLRGHLSWLLFASLTPIVLSIAIHQLGIAPIFLRRYLLGSLWPLCIIPAITLAGSNGKMRVLLAILLCTSIAWESRVVSPSRWGGGRYSAPQRTEKWSEAALQITKLDPDAQLPLFLASGLIESRGLGADASPLLKEYCRLPLSSLYRVPHTIESIEPISSAIPKSPPNAWLETVAERRGGIWIVRLPPERAEGWRRLLRAQAQEIRRRFPAERWSLEEVDVPGITIFAIRPLTNSSF
jgi:mannosyltransferase